MSSKADQIVRNPYVDYRDTIAEVFVNVLSRPAYPLSARLFSLSAFAFETDAFLSPGNPDCVEEQLAAEVNRVADFTYERLWMEELDGKGTDPELLMSMIQSLLLGRVRNCAPAFSQTIVSAWSEWIHENRNPGGRLLDIRMSETATRVDCTRLTRQYIDRRNRTFALLGPEVENHLRDFCIRFVQSRDYKTDDTLVAYVQRLMLNVALLKYFLVSDPDLAVGIRQIDSGASGPREMTLEDRRALGRAVCGITQRIEYHLKNESRAIDGLHQLVREQGMQDFWHTALFVFF